MSSVRAAHVRESRCKASKEESSTQGVVRAVTWGAVLNLLYIGTLHSPPMMPEFQSSDPARRTDLSPATVRQPRNITGCLVVRSDVDVRYAAKGGNTLFYFAYSTRY